MVNGIGYNFVGGCGMVMFVICENVVGWFVIIC